MKYGNRRTFAYRVQPCNGRLCRICLQGAGYEKYQCEKRMLGGPLVRLLSSPNALNWVVFGGTVY